MERQYISLIHDGRKCQKSTIGKGKIGGWILRQRKVKRLFQKIYFYKKEILDPDYRINIYWVFSGKYKSIFIWKNVRQHYVRKY